MNLKEEERRARLLKSRAERLPDIKRQFEDGNYKLENGESLAEVKKRINKSI